jgi:hypothetical protein
VPNVENIIRANRARARPLLDRYGEWIVIGLPYGDGGLRRVRCRCSCGAEHDVLVHGLKSGRSLRCRRCGRRNADRPQQLKHGHTAGGMWSPEYRAWKCMLTRCLNSGRPDWDDYGGRGVTVCAEWQRSFSAFFAHVGHKPSPRHSLDRIDNDRGYEPGNVRWATPEQQANNRRPRRWRRRPTEEKGAA